MGVLLAMPFIFDVWFITADFLPAYLLFGIVAYRSMTLRAINAAHRTHAGTLLPNLSALREEAQASALPLIAMRIRNYAAICSSFPNRLTPT
jgi:hypothetical protein